jgi:large subunit ribosomal protein L37Ae
MTKKVKRLGRLGSKYGVGIRKRVLKIETEQYAKHACPNCSAPKVKRLAAGIFKCRKCGLEFTGGAYVPETMTGTIVKKMVVQRTFLPNLKELIESKEETSETELPKKEHKHHKNHEKKERAEEAKEEEKE